MLGFVSDVMVAAAAMGAAVYCLVLARKVQALRTLDQGMGGAIAVLSAQVDDLTKALAQARDSARDNADRLAAQTQRADAASRRIELMLAALHDLPRTETPAPAPQPADSGPRSGSHSGPQSGPDDDPSPEPPAPWMRSWGRAGLSPAPRLPADPPRAVMPEEPAAQAGRGRILHRRRTGA